MTPAPVGRVVDNTQIKANVDLSLPETARPDRINPVLCDKFDNSRFTLRDIGGNEAATVNKGGNPAPFSL
ncbi:MAG: hypothetical protein R3C44_15080 [Chloroflexota bacterium]